MGAATYRKWHVLSRLQQKLQAIKGPGSGYHHDLGERVYFRLLEPGEDATIALPYVCIPQLGDPSAPGGTLQHGQDVHWVQPIIAFVEDPQASVLTGEAVVRDCSDMEDDLRKAVLGEPTLSGLVADWDIGPTAVLAGILSDDKYGEVHMQLEFMAATSFASLGP